MIEYQTYLKMPVSQLVGIFYVYIHLLKIICPSGLYHIDIIYHLCYISIKYQRPSHKNVCTLCKAVL